MSRITHVSNGLISLAQTKTNQCLKYIPINKQIYKFLFCIVYGGLKLNSISPCFPCGIIKCSGSNCVNWCQSELLISASFCCCQMKIASFWGQSRKLSFITQIKPKRENISNVCEMRPNWEDVSPLYCTDCNLQTC